jgi:hypothetical protein
MPIAAHDLLAPLSKIWELEFHNPISTVVCHGYLYLACLLTYAPLNINVPLPLQTRWVNCHDANQSFCTRTVSLASLQAIRSHGCNLDKNRHRYYRQTLSTHIICTTLTKPLGCSMSISSTQPAEGPNIHHSPPYTTLNPNNSRVNTHVFTLACACSHWHMPCTKVKHHSWFATHMGWQVCSCRLPTFLRFRVRFTAENTAAKQITNPYTPHGCISPACRDLILPCYHFIGSM